MADPGGLSRSNTAGPRPSQDARRPLISDGFNNVDLGADSDAPPAYGDFHDKLQLSHAGFEAGAAVTGKIFCSRLVCTLLSLVCRGWPCQHQHQ